MLLILIFCIYVIATSHVKITRDLTLSGLRARQFAITLIVLMIPVQVGTDLVLALMLPRGVLSHPIAGRVINVTILASFAVLLALGFRAIERRTSPTVSSDVPPN